MTLENFAENVGGKVWRKGGKVRIYFDTDKNASAYLDYDEDLGDEFEKGNEGATLKVFSNCESQTWEWNKNRAKQILENTRVELAQQFGKNQTHTYFTRDFVDKIDELAKKGSMFESKEAQEFIQLVKDWHTLNKNHADILFDLRPADVKNVRQGIATRIQGRLEQMRTNILMSNMFRLLDKIPFANALWDKTQAGALRFHIKNALSNSVSIDDFKLKLLDKVEQGKFDNKTKQLLREIIGEADNAEKTLNEMQRVENEVLRMSDESVDLPAKSTLQSDTQKAVEATPSAPASKGIINESGLKLDKARDFLKENVNFETLNDEQKGVFEVLTGKKDRIILQGKDINDLYTLEQGSRNAGAKKILIKHAGVEKTGGLSNDELLDMMKVVREGNLDKDSFVLFDNKMRYAYDLDKDGVKLRLVVDEYNDGRKVFDYYSDRNFTDYGQTAWQKAQNPPPKSQIDNFKNESADLPTKSTLQKDLPEQEIKQTIDTWDLNNPSPNDKILISKVQGDELEQLKKEFDFKGNYALAREIEAKNVKHALTQHGDEAQEAARGQIAITKDDIAGYQKYTQEPDLRVVQDNNRIIYAKQVNGHYVVIEEVLTGQNKLQFFDMWKGKGEINKEVLLSHSQRPKHDFEPNSNRHMPSNTDDIIPNTPPKSQIDDLKNEMLEQSQAQEPKTLHPTLQTIKEHYESALESTNNHIKDYQAELKRLKADKEATTINKPIIAEYSADLAKAMKEKTAYKKEIKKLAKIEPLLRTAEKRLNEFAKNPNIQDLKAIYKLKNQLLSVESDLKPAFFWKYDKEHQAILNKVADMLDLAFESIRTAKESLAVKQADPKALTPTQAFLNFVDDTKRQIDYTLSFGKDTTLKTLDEIAKDYTNSAPHLNFIKRKKAEVEAHFKGNESVINTAPKSQGEPKKVQIEMTTRDINRKNKLENENKILEKQIQEAQKEYEKHLPKLEQLKQKENEAFQKWRLLWDEPKKENPSPEALKAYKELEKEFEKARKAQDDFKFDFLREPESKLNKAKSQISKNQQSLEKLAKKYENLQMQSDISAKELLEHNVINADFVRARDSVSVNENIIQKAERENFKLPDNIFQYENRELEIQPNIAKRYLGAHAHNQNELEKAMSYLVNEYIERFIRYRGGGLKSVGKEKALERLRFLDDLQREIQYEKEALSGGESAKKQVLKDDESAENEPLPKAQTQGQSQIQKSFTNFYENLPSDIKNKADKKDLQVIHEFLNDFDFEKDIIKGSQNAKLAEKINKLARKNPSFSFDNGKTNELYNLDNYIDFTDNSQVIKDYISGELHSNLTQAGFFVPKDSAKQATFAKNTLKIPQAFDNLTPKDNALMRVLKKQAHFESANSDKDILNRLYIDEARLAKMRSEIEQATNTTPLQEFGTNYAEFYHDGINAVKKLLAEKQGQVAGAFFRDDLGDITLAWGKIGTGKSDGFGLAKIEKYHPEVLDNLTELVEKSPIVKESDNRYLLDTPTHFLAIRKEFDGQKENWLLTAFEKDESIARRRTDLPSSQSEVEKTTSTNTQSNSSQNLKQSQIDERTNPNILMANQHLGAGLLGGTLNGIETDENGNVTFSPEKFVAGFLGGSVASKIGIDTIKRLAKYPKARQILDKMQVKDDIIPALKQGKKVKEQDIIKALEHSSQKGRDMLVIGKENLSENVLEWALKNNKKVAVDILPDETAQKLGFKYPNVKRTIGASEVEHTLQRHGENSPLVQKSGQKPVTLENIKKWTDYADEALYHTTSKDKLGQKIFLSGKQINGYYVVVESVRKKHNELGFKTMYFENGDLFNHKDFKKFKKTLG